MSDIGSATPQQDIDKIINEVLKAWEKYGFKDMDLWETFQEDFEGFTEEDFRSANNYNARRLRNYLRKYGIWIRKQQRYTIAKSLYKVLLEEEPTPRAYIQPSGPTSAPYIQPPGTRLPPAAYTPPGTGPTSAAYMQPSGIGSTLAAYATIGGHTQPSSTRPAHAVQSPPSAIQSG